ncbi:MAG: hypothetical protein ACP5D0_04880 [Hydrogenovibrio sp.]
MQHKIRRAEGALIIAMQDWLRDEAFLGPIEEATEHFDTLMPFELDDGQWESLWQSMMIYYILLDWPLPETVDEMQGWTLGHMFATLFELEPFDRKVLFAMLDAPFTFVQVQDVVEGKGLYLHDLLLDRDVYVEEQTASISRIKGDILFTKIVSMNTVSVMISGFPFSLPGRFAEPILNLRQAIQQDHSLSLDGLLSIKEALIREYWQFYGIVNAPPIMRNQDGDFIEPNELVYHTKLSLNELIENLLPLSPFADLDEMLLEGATYDAKGKLQQVDFPRVDQYDVVLAQFSVTEGRIVVATNSAKRAGRVKSSFTRRFGKKLTLVDQIWHPPEAFKSSGVKPLIHTQAASANEPLELSEPSEPAFSLENFDDMSPQLLDMLRVQARNHWQGWLEHPIPALMGKTPRQATKTKAGREQLETLLLDFEDANQQDPANPMNPDIAWLRAQLKME